MYPHLRLTGDATTRGQQYGELARDRVRLSIAAYQSIFAHYAKWDWVRVTAEAERFLTPISAYGEHYIAELQGIADGANVPLLDIVAINVRTEIMFAAKARDASVSLPRAGECTAFVAIPDSGGGVLIGQNWDWKAHAFDTTVILEVDPSDGPRYVTVVEAGLLAKAGMNEHGIGIATNALICSDDAGEPGVPYHVLLRAMLETTNPTDALIALQRAGRASSASYLIGHRDGLGLGVEAAPGDFSRLFLTQPDQRGLVLHANHFTHPDFDRVDVGVWAMPDSVFRLQRITRELQRSNPYAGSTFETLLADHAGHPNGICCHPSPSSIPAENDATIFGLIMNLTDQTMRLSDGPPCQAGYRTLDYSEFFALR